MIVMKFGGTSVGSASRMKSVAQLISNEARKRHVLVVLSAMSGTTNALLQIADELQHAQLTMAEEHIQFIEDKYKSECIELGIDFVVEPMITVLRQCAKQTFCEQVMKNIVALGELMSTTMMSAYMQVPLINALDFMRLDEDEEPDMKAIQCLLLPIIKKHCSDSICITQGFICRDHREQISNLKRGGSDYTASIVGGLLEAEEIQIWTDIDGMHNNDPRYVPDTRPVPQLSFSEAAELAYFGAKILHPTCILPAKQHNVPVRLKNTLDASAHGTIINNDYRKGRIEAIAVKDGIAVIRVVSDRMLLAYGFLSRLFSIFERYKTSIDLITTSEVAVSMSIDNLSHIGQILPELEALGTVALETNMSIISVVGDLHSQNLGFESKVVNALSGVPVRMISYGGSDHNISILVRNEDRSRALLSLHNALFI